MAQGNLVPNPSFELYSNCPTNFGQIYYAIDWKSPTVGSPEYFNSCSTSFGVPDNYCGSQNTNSGNAYVGGVIYGGGFTEYIQVRLTNPLQVGKTYCVAYFVSLAGLSGFESIGPQAYFSNDSIWNNTTTNFSYTPQIVVGNLINDTTNWVQISGEFTAVGGEKYLTIGNFFDSTNTTYDTINFSPLALPGSYFYIDDVSVYEKANADAGNNKTICLGDSVKIGSSLENGIIYRWNTISGLNDSTIAQPWAKPLQTTSYYLTISDTGGLYCTGNLVDSVTITVNDCTPLPVFSIPTILKGDEILFISALPPNSSLELYDARGRLVMKEDNYQNNFSVVNLAAGIYSYRLVFPDKTSQQGKICVVK